MSSEHRPFPPPVTAAPARATAPSRRHVCVCVCVCPPLPVTSAHRLGRAALTRNPQLRSRLAAASALRPVPFHSTPSGQQTVTPAPTAQTDAATAPGAL